MFICAESLSLPAGQFNSAASCLRADRLLSNPSSFNGSTIDTFQLSFSGLLAANASSRATTSMTATATGAGALTPIALLSRPKLLAERPEKSRFHWTNYLDSQ
jgi:hypothetical protein